MVKIAPSILSADLARLGDQVRLVDVAGADYVHIDVMDGHFVPNITMGPVVIRSIRSWTKLPFDVHLMIERPEQYIDDFADAGADIITVQQEASTHLHRVVERIKALGKRAGVAINPATPIQMLQEIADFADLFLVMTVNPGFGGQSFIESMPAKIAGVRQMISSRRLHVELEVDGGIHLENVQKVVQAGADTLVAGSAVFLDPAGVEEAVRKLRKNAEKPASLA